MANLFYIILKGVLDLNTTVFWNNVCLLSKVEKQFINEQSLYNNLDKTFSFEYFGLGQSTSLFYKLKNEINEKICSTDIIVSTDLEIFQNPLFSSYFESNFKQSSKNDENHDWILNHPTLYNPSNLFSPYIVIPLVIIVNEGKLNGRRPPSSIEDLFSDSFKDDVVFGGIQNSAGFSLMKSIWWLYGKENLVKFMKNSHSRSMPAQAFQSVLKGEHCVGVVPSIFALRQGTRQLKAIWPKEGAIAIPSYVAVSKRLADKTFNLFNNTFLGEASQKLLVTSGDILPTHKNISISSQMMDAFVGDNFDKSSPSFIFPDWSFTEGMDYEFFYDLARKKI